MRIGERAPPQQAQLVRPRRGNWWQAGSACAQFICPAEGEGIQAGLVVGTRGRRCALGLAIWSSRANFGARWDSELACSRFYGERHQDSGFEFPIRYGRVDKVSAEQERSDSSLGGKIQVRSFNYLQLLLGALSLGWSIVASGEGTINVKVNPDDLGPCKNEIAEFHRLEIDCWKAQATEACVRERQHSQL